MSIVLNMIEYNRKKKMIIGIIIINLKLKCFQILIFQSLF